MGQDRRYEKSFENLGNALSRLETVLNEPLDKNDYVLDATIHRFEFVIELYWKALKHLLAHSGRLTELPKQTLQEAYAANWLSNESEWLNMLKDRNQTSHTYKHELALQVYDRIKQYCPEMRKTYDNLLVNVIPKLGS